MRKQSYYFNEYGIESNIKNISVPFQTNCCGANLQEKSYSTQSNTRHDFYYFYLLSGDYTFNDQKMTAGDVLILEPETEYQGYSENGFNYLWVHYTGFEALSFTRSVFGKTGQKKHIGIHKDICSIFKKMYREFIIADSASKEISVCLLKEILSLTGRYIKNSNDTSLPLSSMEYIHEHFTEDVQIDSLAAFEYLSPNNFRIMFKKHTGMSPNDYIIMQRIHAACSMLSQTNLQIKEIASSVGYSDQYYFSRLFKKKTGTSPLKYRLKNKTKL